MKRRSYRKRKKIEGRDEKINSELVLLIVDNAVFQVSTMCNIDIVLNWETFR